MRPPVAQKREASLRRDARRYAEQQIAEGRAGHRLTITPVLGGQARQPQAFEDELQQLLDGMLDDTTWRTWWAQFGLDSLDLYVVHENDPPDTGLRPFTLRAQGVCACAGSCLLVRRANSTARPRTSAGGAASRAVGGVRLRGSPGPAPDG